MTHLLVACVLAATACTTTYDYEPAEIGEPEASAREPRSKTSSQFVRDVYADLLGRTPETYDVTLTRAGVTQATLPIDEQTELVNVLDGLGDALPVRNLIVNGLLHSTEVTLPGKTEVSDPRTYIRQQFTRLLGREPNAYELQGFADAWATDPAVGPRTILRAIVGSRAYQSH